MLYICEEALYVFTAEGSREERCAGDVFLLKQNGKNTCYFPRYMDPLSLFPISWHRAAVSGLCQLLVLPLVPADSSISTSFNESSPKVSINVLPQPANGKQHWWSVWRRAERICSRSHTLYGSCLMTKLPSKHKEKNLNCHQTVYSDLKICCMLEPRKLDLKFSFSYSRHAGFHQATSRYLQLIKM